MRVELTESWGRHAPGEVIECDETRGLALLSADKARPVGEASGSAETPELDEDVG